jgi:hypothetical protein
VEAITEDADTRLGSHEFLMRRTVDRVAAARLAVATAAAVY